MINGKKISGSAAHVFKNRVLHDGTLLFDTNLDELEQAITPYPTTVEDKAVQSIRKAVANISDYTVENVSLDIFKDMLQIYVVNYFNINEIKKLKNTDIARINELVERKYSQWEWNYGYSPKYTFRNKTR